RGTQTAIVTGPSGEEIYVDEYGRVKVHFHWDRLGKSDDTSSLWVRVATPWAGKTWGMVHLPRVGQEVVVTFLDGDPDRPLITGLVYNAEQMPPYALPANKTQSGIKSRSSPGGSADNFNEIRFEDKKGSELVYVHVEKDLTTDVKNDETRSVLHDRTTTIKNNETQTVSEGDETITVAKGNQIVAVSQGDQTVTVGKGNQTITIGQGNQSLTIKQGNQTVEISQGKQDVTIMGNRTTQIKQGNDELDVNMGNLTTKVAMGNVATTVSLGEISMTALQGIELTVGENSIKIDQSGVTIQGMTVNVTGQIQTQIKGLITQVNADAMLQLKGGVTMIN
ncbi:MAG TPA: type VI secretion system tip protein TssI/VgrG, partial [Gemmatimonadaceae bacterium]|nr:type VI secretion system tip protein TssI/VgrG [Gemmatimonadaceae bacterium]